MTFRSKVRQIWQINNFMIRVGKYVSVMLGLDLANPFL